MTVPAAGGFGDPGVEALLRQAAEWRLLGLLLERPRDGWPADVEALAGEVSDPEIKVAAGRAREEATEGAYLALLGPGGVVSPREVSYRGMEDPGHVIAGIMAFYEAFAFHPETEEAPDHFAVEAGFLGYLCLKEAYARARGKGGQAELAAEAAASFREAHLATFAGPVAGRLEASDVRYLGLAAQILARRAGPRRGPEPTAGPLRLACDDGCPLECGSPGNERRWSRPARRGRGR